VQTKTLLTTPLATRRVWERVPRVRAAFGDRTEGLEGQLGVQVRGADFL